MPFPATEQMVAVAERGLGRRLPDAHRARLIRDNGGEIAAYGQTWWLFPVWDATDRRTIGRTTNHILRENEILRRGPNAIPERYVAIADDGGGNLLVLASDGDTVFAWDHETGALDAVEVDWSGSPSEAE